MPYIELFKDRKGNKEGRRASESAFPRRAWERGLSPAFGKREKNIYHYDAW
jgi:hypothetical protein